MDAGNQEVAHDIFPFLRVYKDGTVERLVETEHVPAGLDSQTDVLSKDVLVVPETGVSARLYLPNSTEKHRKLPLVVYFHGGAFCIGSPADRKYHTILNRLVAEAKILVVSVDYRLAPENPLPAAYEDSWAALEWVASHHSENDGGEVWLKDHADFDRLFLSGDSAGANISHYLALRSGNRDANNRKLKKIAGIGMIHPCLWGKASIGSEMKDEARKKSVDQWWTFVCPTEKGCDDPLINPFADGATDLSNLGCDRVLVTVAEKDILRDRGKLYYDTLVEIGWTGSAEFMETEEEDHVFHLFQPDSEKSKRLMKRLTTFFAPEDAPVASALTE